MKRNTVILIVAAAAVIAAMIAGLFWWRAKYAAVRSDTNDTSAIGMPNPFVEFDSLDKAAERAGFTLDAPDTMNNLKRTAIRVLPASGDDSAMIELVYGNEDADSAKIVVRKTVDASKSSDTDISGDYTVYDDSNTINMGDETATLRGTGQQSSLAVWSDGKNHYSIGIYNEDGVDEKTMSDWILQIK